MSKILVVRSKVKEIAKGAGLRVGADFIQVLSQKVEEITNEAIARVKAEGKRVTLGAEDIMSAKKSPQIKVLKSPEPPKGEEPSTPVVPPKAAESSPEVGV